MSDNGHDPVPVAASAHASMLVPFSGITARPVRWAWRDRIALAKITALAGRPKIGKGLLYSHLVAQMTRGRLDGDLAGPRKAIIVTTEDDPGDTLKPRLMGAGADLTRVAMFQMGSRDDPIPFRIPQDTDELHRRVREKDVALVVIDPLVEFIDGKVDSHKSHPVRQAIASLNAIARDTGCAILVIFHLNKSASTDPLLRHEASAAFTQVVRGGMLLGHDPDDPEGERGSRRVLAVTSSNLAQLAPSLVYEINTEKVIGDTGEPITTATITCAGESEASGYDLLKQTNTDATAGNDVEEQIGQRLKDGPRPSLDVKTEVANKLDCSTKTVERAAVRMRDAGELLIESGGFPRTTTWELIGWRSLNEDGAVGTARASISVPTEQTPAATGDPSRNGSSADSRDGLLGLDFDAQADEARRAREEYLATHAKKVT